MASHRCITSVSCRVETSILQIRCLDIIRNVLGCSSFKVSTIFKGLFLFSFSPRQRDLAKGQKFAIDRGNVKFELTLFRTKGKKKFDDLDGCPDMCLGVKISRVRFWEARIAGWAGYSSQMLDLEYLRRYSHFTGVTGKVRSIRIEQFLVFWQLGCLRPPDETRVDNVRNMEKNLHGNGNSILMTLLRAERINFHPVCFTVASVVSH